MSERRFDPRGPLHGRLRPPADKSISHRAALIGAMSEGDARISNFLDSEDTLSTLAAVAALGADVTAPLSEGHGMEVMIGGVGLRGPAEASIDVGNAGTLLRLLPGWLAGQGRGAWTLDGDKSIRRRPVDRVADPLRLMGARLECRDGRLPPLSIAGADLEGISYEMPIASAQVKSCLLLAGLLAEGDTEVIEPAPSRDHTERMLVAAGAEIDVRGDAGERVRVMAAERLQPQPITVPGDVSSAAFAIVAALLVPGSELQIEGVGLNPTRTGLLRVLRRMGAELEPEEHSPDGGEPSGTILVRASRLSSTEVGGEEIPLMIDELPLLALAACFAEGTTVIRDAGELRHKESDRIAGVCDALRALGGEVEATPDGMVIEGTGGLSGGTLSARGDHRLAMLGAVAGLASREGATVDGFEAVAVSYPDFERDLANLTG
jgi:3-phosphoshikimate 1-carboxyvinyltransferase